MQLLKLPSMSSLRRSFKVSNS
uniref:Uncharacterized protein n=1 Tax=Rhizophora mucronata TaxID=61149 RepID=A0A2P2PHM2_RHIMU